MIHGLYDTNRALNLIPQQHEQKQQQLNESMISTASSIQSLKKNYVTPNTNANVKKGVTFTHSTIEKAIDREEKNQHEQQPHQNMIVMRAPTPGKRFNFDNPLSPETASIAYGKDTDYDIRNISASYRSETSSSQSQQTTPSIILTPKGTRITKSSTSIENSANKRRDHHHLRVETSSSTSSTSYDDVQQDNTSSFSNLAEVVHRRDTPVAQLTKEQMSTMQNTTSENLLLEIDESGIDSIIDDIDSELDDFDIEKIYYIP